MFCLHGLVPGRLGLAVVHLLAAAAAAAVAAAAAAAAAVDAAAAAAAAAAPHPSPDSAELGVCREDCAHPRSADIQRGVGALLVLLKLLLLFVLGQVPFRPEAAMRLWTSNLVSIWPPWRCRLSLTSWPSSAQRRPFVARAPCLRPVSKMRSSALSSSN